MSAPRILVIEDNPGDVQLLRHGLSQQNEPYELIVLWDGEAALHFINEQRSGTSTEPCVIVLDLHLPKHDGMEVLRALRRDPILNHISVVMLTSVANPKDETEVRRLGAHFREKPADLSAFLALAEFILELCKSYLQATT
jgi:CheY-like chemotaxis protein